MATFRIVKAYDGRYVILSGKGTSVTGKRFVRPSLAEAWVARNYEGVQTVREAVAK